LFILGISLLSSRDKVWSTW